MKRLAEVTAALMAMALTLGVAQAQTPSGGVSGYQVVVGQTALDATVSKQLRVDCPAGRRALGAGWAVVDSTGAILEGQATYFEPAPDGSHWLTNARNLSGFARNWRLRVRVICADAR
jgi:hypothetical protein